MATLSEDLRDSARELVHIVDLVVQSYEDQERLLKATLATITAARTALAEPGQGIIVRVDKARSILEGRA